MNNLATNTPHKNIEPIQSNELPICLDCGIPITKENDSGWEGFTEDGRTTQPICKTCDLKRSKRIRPKSKL